MVVPGDETHVLFTEGPFTITGKCDLDSTTDADSSDLALVLISTTENNAAFDGDQGGAGDLDTTTPEVDRRILRALHDPDVPVYGSASFNASSPTGTDLSGVLYGSVNSVGRQDQCLFGGHVVVG